MSKYIPKLKVENALIWVKMFEEKIRGLVVLREASIFSLSLSKD